VAASIVTPVILTACGGSAAPKTQIVQGAGFRFEAPSAWKVARTSQGVTASEGVGLAQVLVYPLVKPYDPAKFAAVTTELDQRAEQLAGQLKAGKVVDKATTRMADRKVRSYRLEFDEHGAGRTEEIAFVLQGKTEYFVLCRREPKASDADCARLFSSFSLG
jgi:hypothetical protein